MQYRGCWTNFKAEHCKHIGLAGFEPAPSNLQTECSPNKTTVLVGSLQSSAYIASLPIVTLVQTSAVTI